MLYLKQQATLLHGFASIPCPDSPQRWTMSSKYSWNKCSLSLCYFGLSILSQQHKCKLEQEWSQRLYSEGERHEVSPYCRLLDQRKLICTGRKQVSRYLQPGLRQLRRKHKRTEVRWQCLSPYYRGSCTIQLLKFIDHASRCIVYYINYNLIKLFGDSGFHTLLPLLASNL